MIQRFLFVLLAFFAVIGCAGPSAKDKLDEAQRRLERAQAKLDEMRPAYDAARATAANAVCRELAGTTPEESASAALAGLSDVLTQPPTPAADGGKAEGAKQGEKANDNGKKPAGKKADELDKTIDNLIAAQKDVQEKQAALTAPVAKANEVMSKIKTAGTPEAKKFEEKLAAMPEAKAYERQQKRVEKAQEEVDEAEEAAK